MCRYYESSGKLENPLNRSVFSEETLDRFLKRVIELGISPEKNSKTIKRERKIQELERQEEILDEQIRLRNERTDERGSRQRHHHRTRGTETSTSSGGRRPRNVTISTTLIRSIDMGGSGTAFETRLFSSPSRSSPSTTANVTPSRPISTFSPYTPASSPNMSNQEPLSPMKKQAATVTRIPFFQPQQTFNFQETHSLPSRDYTALATARESILAASRPSSMSSGGGGGGNNNNIPYSEIQTPPFHLQQQYQVPPVYNHLMVHESPSPPHLEIYMPQRQPFHAQQQQQPFYVPQQNVQQQYFTPQTPFIEQRNTTPLIPQPKPRTVTPPITTAPRVVREEQVEDEENTRVDTKFSEGNDSFLILLCVLLGLGVVLAAFFLPSKSKR